MELSSGGEAVDDRGVRREREPVASNLEGSPPEPSKRSLVPAVEVGLDCVGMLSGNRGLPGIEVELDWPRCREDVDRAREAVIGLGRPTTTFSAKALAGMPSNRTRVCSGQLGGLGKGHPLAAH
jgi:hypothetical protein